MSSSNTVNSIQEALAPLRASRVALLTSFRRNGQGVGTPVDIALADGRFYFTTRLSTGKAKRIGNNPAVTLAPCTQRGKITGPTITGIVRRLEGLEAEEAHALLDRSFMHRLVIRFVQLLTSNDPWGFYEVLPTVKEAV